MSRRQMAHTFKVVFEPEPDGRAWNATIPSIQGCHSWGRSLNEARTNIREALAVSLDDDARDAIAAAAEFDEDVRLPPKARQVVTKFSKVRKEEAALKAQQSDLVRRLNEAYGLSWRDTGELIGMSPEGARKLAQMTQTASTKVRSTDLSRASVHKGTVRTPALRAGKAKSRPYGRKTA